MGGAVGLVGTGGSEAHPAPDLGPKGMQTHPSIVDSTAPPAAEPWPPHQTPKLHIPPHSSCREQEHEGEGDSVTKLHADLSEARECDGLVMTWECACFCGLGITMQGDAGGGDIFVWVCGGFQTPGGGGWGGGGRYSAR